MIPNRKQQFLTHFDKLAPIYTKYKKRFAYYWRDIVAYINYFLTKEQSILDVGCGLCPAIFSTQIIPSAEATCASAGP